MALVLYFAVIGGVLVSSDFLPYVTDNNESFSTHFHARNMLRFGLRPTAGLTDEVNSRDPAAHPYIYTHEGNFPRFPILGLFLLGINRIEWQIAVLAVLVGGVATYFAYKVFSGIGGDLFAFLVVAVFSTDYLMYVQWQVNTFRVWHALFLFASLRCVQRIDERNGLRVGALLFLNSLCLFYFEIIFAFFVALLSTIYAVILYRSQPARIMRIASSLTLGGVVAAGLLLGQMVGHLGMERAWTDIRLTYLARSFGDAASGTQAQVQKLHFFMQNHIVFWDSTFDSNGFLNIRLLQDALRHGIVKLYTPFLTLIGAIVSLSLLIGERPDQKGGEGPLATMGEWTAAPGSRVFGRDRCRLLLGVLCAILGIWWVARLKLYSPAHSALWAGVIRNQVPGIALELMLGVSVLWGLLFFRWGYQRLFGTPNEALRGIIKYLLSGFAAFVLIDAAVPGYVWNGYLSRYAPIPVFITDVWLAAILYVLLMLAYRAGRAVSGGLKSIEVSADNRSRLVEHESLGSLAALSVVSATLLIMVAAYWISLQVAYLTKLPPTAILFMRQLSRPELKGKSFVSDNYALPVEYFTEQWAYQDQTLPADISSETKEGPKLSISGKYIWFADRDTNRSYLHPQYYLCRRDPDLDLAEALTNLPAGGRLDNCSGQHIVRATLAGAHAPFRNMLIAHDPKSSDMWAIVKLDQKIHLVPKD